MSGLTVVAAAFITLALGFYSLGVWAEHLAKFLQSWHVIAFWAGFLFDTLGTMHMGLLEPGFDWMSLHAITVQIALWLMFVHAVWATRVIRRGSEATRMAFHRFSLVVWGIWLVPYIGGMFLGMSG